MAPLDTTTNDAPGLAASDAARRAKTASSPASVREPILTTTRRARATWARGSAIAVREQVVEGGVEPADEARRDARGEAQHAVDERRRRVALVVDRRRLVGQRRVDRERAHDGAVDGLAHAARLARVDAHGALDPPRREVAVEEVPERPRLQRVAQGPEEAKRADAREHAPREAEAEEAHRLGEQAARPVRPRGLAEHVARVVRERHAVADRDVVHE